MKLTFGVVLIALAAVQAPSDLEPTLAGRFSSFMGFHLDSDITLSEVQSRLGPAPLNQRGDAGEYEASICYKTGSGVLGFLSGEMGGPNHRLLGISVSRAPTSRDKKCGEISKPPELTIGGLKLGLSKEQFTEAVQAKVQWEGHTARRFIEDREPIPPQRLAELRNGMPNLQDYFDVQVAVIGRFEKNKLTEFEVWKVRTY